MNSSPLFIEITPVALKALRENHGVELPLERESNGRLTPACSARLVLALQHFLDRNSWQPRTKAYCAIGANGVSLRRLTLADSASDEFESALRLKIESEFPLAPDELAWGWQSVPGESPTSQREVLVAAVKKEMVEDYAQVLQACDLIPIFTLAAVVRRWMCPPQTQPFATLDLGHSQAELMTFDPAIPLAIRVLAPLPPAVLAEEAGQILGANWAGRSLFLSGSSEEPGPLPERQLSNGTFCEVLPLAAGPGYSAATLGLKRCLEQNGAAPSLVLKIHTRAPGSSLNLTAPGLKCWAVGAAVMLCLLLMLPYAEAWLLKGGLERRLQQLQSEKVRLGVIDRELAFLQSLKQSQPPYLDALYLLAKSTAPGAKIDALTMSRRGEIALRGSLRSVDQVTDFRTKLVGSGFFSSVAVEEQTPSPDRQKLSVRITAQWKPLEARTGWTNGPTAEEIEHAKTNQLEQSNGAFPPGMMPPGMMPPGMMPPGMMPPGMMPPGGMPPTPGETPRPKASRR